MELDELKQEWTRYDLALQNKLVLDESALRGMNLSQARKGLQMLILHELANIIVVSLTVIGLVILWLGLWQELKFSIPGMVAIVLGIRYVIVAIQKAQALAKIDFYRTPIVTLQKAVAQIKRGILQTRKQELLMLPVFCISAIPFVFRAIQNRDVYQDLPFFLMEIAVIAGLAYPAILWTNKYLYDKKIQQTEKYLAEIVAFEQEEEVPNEK